MRRSVKFVPLAAFALALGACRAPADPVVVKGLKDEIAKIGSAAECPGDRSEAQVLRIRADVKTIWGNVDKVAGQ